MFIYSPVEGRYFQFGAIMNKVIISIGLQVLG